MDRNSSRFADSVRPEVILKKHDDCSLKRHFRGCLRQVVGYVDILAAKDRERFVWASERDVARHCLKYFGRKLDENPDEKLYDKRMVRRCKKFLREQGIISEQTTRVRGRIVRHGFIVAGHDSVAQMSGNVCILLPLSSAVSSVESSPQSSLACSPPSSLWSSLASSAQNDLEFRSEFLSEFPSESPQEPQNTVTCGDDKKVCREFAESLPIPNPEAFKKYEPSIPPVPQTKTETVRIAHELRAGMANAFSKSRPSERLGWAGFSDIETLAAEFGDEMLLKVWRRWLKTRDTGGMKFHFRMFRKEFDTTRADLDRIEREEKTRRELWDATIAADDAEAQRKREAFKLKRAAEEAEAKRQAELYKQTGVPY